MVLREQAGPLTEKQRKMLEEAERSCNRLGALVTEMSDLGKLESGDLALARQDFDVAALVAEVASRMHEGDDRGVRLDDAWRGSSSDGDRRSRAHVGGRRRITALGPSRARRAGRRRGRVL